MDTLQLLSFHHGALFTLQNLIYVSALALHRALHRWLYHPFVLTAGVSIAQQGYFDAFLLVQLQKDMDEE